MTSGRGGGFLAPPPPTPAPAPFLMTVQPYGIGTDIQWPMAIAGNGQTYVGLIQGESDENDVTIAAWDNAGASLIETRALFDQLNDGGSTIPDTHNQPAVNHFADGTLIVAACGHGSTTMLLKTSDAPWDTTAGFSAPINFMSSKAMTYPQLAVMSSGRVYIRYRGVTGGVATLCQRYSDDGGATWSSELNFWTAGTDNLYSAMACDGTWVDQILIGRAPSYGPGFAMLHVRMDEAGDVYTSDGTQITGFSYPLAPSDLTEVFADGSYRFPRGIVYDAGTPVISWDSAQADPVLLGESRWSGSAWVPETITTSSPLYTGATSTGGGKHAWDNADVFLCGKLHGSTPLDMGGTSGIFRFVRTAGTWDSGTEVTDGSTSDPYAPITVVNAEPEVAFVWPYGDQAPADGDPFSLGLEAVAAA